MIESAAQWFKAAHGNIVTKTAHGMPTTADTADIVSTIKKQLLSQGANESDIEVTADKVSIGGQFWLLPKIKETDTGVMTVRSKDYILNDVFGDKKGATVTDTGDLRKDCPMGGYFIFHIED